MKRAIKSKIRESFKLSKFVIRKLKWIDDIYQYAYKCYLDQLVIKNSCNNKLEIVDGIFKGMKYPGLEAAGSAFGIKLVGLYEEELIPVFERIIGNGYKRVIDIGSAEGYYAIGLARRIEDIKVEAFDIDPYARKLLEKMRKLNCVEDRVRINGICTKKTLAKIFNERGVKSLIISDCEGYEKTLFDRDTSEILSQVDLLIEIHDNIETEKREIYNQIYQTFKNTHNIEIITSMSTAEKAYKHLGSKLLTVLKEEELISFMREREWKMVWLFMTAK